MIDTLKNKLGRLENVMNALFEMAEHEIKNKDADALIEVLKDIQQASIEINILKSILKRDIFNK